MMLTRLALPVLKGVWNVLDLYRTPEDGSLVGGASPDNLLFCRC